LAQLLEELGDFLERADCEMAAAVAGGDDEPCL
jgi:hypothetical protein